MKKVILSLLAVAALASCVQTEELGVANNKEAIAFDNAFVDNATKSIDPSINNGSITSFKVYGTTKSLDNGAGTEVNIFNGVEVVKNGTGAWSYSNDHIQYWIADNEYKFAAVVNGTVNTDTVGLPATIEYTADGATDLLYAESETVGQASNNPAVKFTFNHLLAKAKFTVHNTIATNTADNEVTYRVSDVKINAYASATYNVENGGAWDSQYGTFETAFGHIDHPVTEGALLAVDSTVAVKGGHKADSHDARLLIPGAYDELNITCKIETLLNGKVVDIVNYNKNVKITLAKGTSYNFVLSLGNPGDVVEFAVEKVEGWLPDVDLPVYGGAVYVSSTAELKAAVESDQVATIVLQNDINLADFTRAVADVTLTVKSGKELTLDLNGYTIRGVDTGTASYGLITNSGNLSIVGPGSIILLATNERNWNSYSSVISNAVGGNLVVDGGVTIEHLGGTKMAYALDNLTNGRGTKAVATIKSATLKSTYRAVRQFLNGTEAFNELYVKAGAVIETTGNKAIWMQSPSNNANSGKLVVESGAQLKNNVYVDAPAAMDIEISVAESALVNGATIDIELPEGYALTSENGVYSVVYDVVMVTTAEELAEVVNGATEDITVGLANDLQGAITLNKNSNPDVDVLILGNNKTFAGKIHIWGAGGATSTMTIKGVNFVAEGSYGDQEACIYTLGNINGTNSYARNVTIDGCTFSGTGETVAAIRHAFGGTNDWTIKNCTVNAGMHSFLQIANVNSGLVVENCKAYSKNGVNLNQTHGATFTGCEFDVKGYAVRVGVNQTDSYSNEQYTFTNCDLKSQCDGGDAVVVVRGTAQDATLNFVECVVEGTNTISGFTSDTTVNGIELPQLNNQIWYTATALVHAHWYKDKFGEGTDLVSNVWDETTGKGVITLSGDVTKIGSNAFYYDGFHDSRENLISISLPNTVTEIGEAAFDHCPNLTTVTFNNNLVTIGPGAFIGCAKLTNVVLPESLTTIGDSAFNSCTSLKSITIPAGVTSIGSFAFNGISDIKVYCKPTTPPTVGSTPFNQWWAEIYVPTASLAAYQQAWGSVVDNIYDGNF